jgi:hypothetical protein
MRHRGRRGTACAARGAWRDDAGAARIGPDGGAGGGSPADGGLEADISLLTDAIEVVQRTGQYAKFCAVSYCRSWPNLFSGRVAEAIADGQAAVAAWTAGGRPSTRRPPRPYCWRVRGHVATSSAASVRWPRPSCEWRPWPPLAARTAKWRRPCSSPQAVEYHLGNVPRKLGIATRGELPGALGTT